MNKKHRDYLVRGWKKVICDDNEIAGLFKVLKIEHLKNIRVLSRNVTDGDGLILVISAEDTNGKLVRALIEAIAFMPTWRQFIHTTYILGESADIRIILYGQDDRRYRKSGSVAGGVTEIGNLVRRNNRCGMNTYLARGIRFGKGGKKYLGDLHLEQGPDSVSLDKNEVFPSKRQVQEAEFWAGYYLPQQGPEYIDDIGIEDDIISDWAPGYSLRKDLKTETSWNDRGLFVKLLEENPTEAIHWIWNNKRSEFEKAYPGCNIKLEKIDNERSAISIRILDISMSDLINMSSGYKWHYGKYVFGLEHNFHDVVEGIIDEYCDAMRA